MNWGQKVSNQPLLCGYLLAMMMWKLHMHILLLQEEWVEEMQYMISWFPLQVATAMVLEISRSWLYQQDEGRRCTMKFNRTKLKKETECKIKVNTPWYLILAWYSISSLAEYIIPEETERKKMAVFTALQEPACYVESGAEAVAADRLFSTSGISNGWNVTCVWMSFLYGSFHLTIWWNACRE